MTLANLNLGNEGRRIVASITEQSVIFGNLVYRNKHREDAQIVQEHPSSD